MPSPELVEYQGTISQNLRDIYPNVPVELEWASTFDNNMYSPRVDIAVGPFALEHDMRLTEDYDHLMNDSRDFVHRLIRHHLRNVEGLDDQAPVGEVQRHLDKIFEHLTQKNQNARCFLAIEIENQVTRKHLMGSAINAAALGRIGIAVAWTDEKLRAFVRLHRYFNFIYDVKNNTFDISNLLIVSSRQLQIASEWGQA